MVLLIVTNLCLRLGLRSYGCHRWRRRWLRIAGKPSSPPGLPEGQQECHLRARDYGAGSPLEPVRQASNRDRFRYARATLVKTAFRLRTYVSPTYVATSCPTGAPELARASPSTPRTAPCCLRISLGMHVASYHQYMCIKAWLRCTKPHWTSQRKGIRVFLACLAKRACCSNSSSLCCCCCCRIIELVYDSSIIAVGCRHTALT